MTCSGVGIKHRLLISPTAGFSIRFIHNDRQPTTVNLVNPVSISAINARNQIRGVIKFIQLGDAVSEVEVDTADGVLISVIRTSSLVDMGLRVGVEVIAVVKATEVALTKP